MAEEEEDYVFQIVTSEAEQKKVETESRISVLQELRCWIVSVEPVLAPDGLKPETQEYRPILTEESELKAEIFKKATEIVKSL